MQSVKSTAAKKNNANRSLLLTGKKLLSGCTKKYQANAILSKEQKIDGQKLVRKAVAKTAGKKKMNGNPNCEKRSFVANLADRATTAIDAAKA